MPEVPMTASRMSMQIDNSPERNFRRMVDRAVAYALQSHEGQWRTDDRRDARDVAGAACHFLMAEIKANLKDAERAVKFAKDLDVFGRDSD